MARVVTFGELMVRLQPYHYERFVQTDHLEFTFGGGTGGNLAFKEWRKVCGIEQIGL